MVLGGDAGVGGEVDAGAGEQLHLGAVDVPAHPAGEFAGPAQGQGKMGVVDDRGAVDFYGISLLGGAQGGQVDGGWLGMWS